MKRTLLAVITAGAILGAMGRASAITVGVDPSKPWQGFMNVFELPSNGGAYVFGSGWGVNDLTAVFSPGVLTLGPNTIADASAFWYTPSGGPGAMGNKIMDANFYVEDSTPAFVGQSVTFQGTVSANTLTSSHSVVAFIKDFAPDYSTNVSATVALNPGPFSVTLNTIPVPGRHVQFGFEMQGPDVWITDVGPYGSVKIGSVPEPASASLIVVSLAGLVRLARRRK